MSGNKDFPFEYARAANSRQVSLSELLNTSGDRCALLSDAGATVVPPYRLWATEGLSKPTSDSPASVKITALENCHVYGPNFLLRKGKLISPSDTEPPYVERFMGLGLPRNFPGYPVYGNGLPQRHVKTAFFVSHFNQHVYGHFLLEIVPKLFHIDRLIKAGMNFPLVLTANAPEWMRSIIQKICPGIDILTFDPFKEIVNIESCLLISNCFSTNYFLHPQTVTDFRLFAMRARMEFSTAPRARRLLVVRDDPQGFRYMTNFSAIEDLCTRHGFVPISPTDYSWTEQAAIFGSAKIIVGEFTSALHNTVFTPPDACLITLNHLWGVQEGLCASFGHRVGYVLPSDGRPRGHIPGNKTRQDYEIDLTEFQERLSTLLRFDA